MSSVYIHAVPSEYRVPGTRDGLDGDDASAGEPASSAVPPPSHPNGPGLDRAAVVTGLVATVVAVVVGGVFAWLGVVNGDEGWYAVDARLVAGGALPYRDFAFTQGPVFLFVLAPVLRIVPNLYAARAVSVACTGIGVGLLFMVAHRIGGKWAVRCSALALLATIPSLPYWLSITKTYALSFLLIALIVFTLTSAVPVEARYPLAVAFAVILAMTRTPGLVLAVLLVVALLVMAPTVRTRLLVVGAALVVSAPVALLIARHWTQARWGLFAYHQLGTPTETGLERFWVRTLDVARAWPGPTLLGAAAVGAVLTSPQLRHRLARRLDLLAVAVGMVAFVFAHEFGARFFAEEYVVPVVAPVLVLSVTVLVVAIRLRPAATRSRRARTVLAGLVVVGFVVTVFTGGHRPYLGRPGWGGNPAALAPITRCVQRHTAPGDVVYALSFEDVVLDADRKPADGVSLGMFSYHDVSTKRARELEVLNSARLAELFRSRRPKVAVLTVADIYEAKRAGFFSRKPVENLALYQAFQAYRPVCRATVMRATIYNVNRPVEVTVYARD